LAIAFVDGALVASPYERAFWSLFDLAGAVGGETVLVPWAAGSVGAGLRVLATCAKEDEETVLAQGALATLDYRSEAVEAWALA
jgi:NADPH-dependent curcumin reductase CurA